MMVSSIRKLLAIVSLSCLLITTQAQGIIFEPSKSSSKPYTVLTSGKQITIKSTKEIKHVMLWTTNGNRVVEQKEINAVTFAFTIPVSSKVFFLMVGLNDGKIYTEKIGIQ